jgi:hypothetical protein
MNAGPNQTEFDTNELIGVARIIFFNWMLLS